MYDAAIPAGMTTTYEDWESKPGDFNTGGIALAERDLGRNRPIRKQRFQFGFAVEHSAARQTRTRHRGSVARR